MVFFFILRSQRLVCRCSCSRPTPACIKVIPVFLAGAGDPERVKGMRDTSGERGWNRRENYRFRARSSPNGEERTIRAEPPHGHVLSSYPERASDLTPLVAQATNWRRNVKSIHLTLLHKQANKQTNSPMSMSRSDRRTCNESVRTFSVSQEQFAARNVLETTMPAHHP